MDNLFGWLAKGEASKDVEDGTFVICLSRKHCAKPPPLMIPSSVPSAMLAEDIGEQIDRCSDVLK